MQTSTGTRFLPGPDWLAAASGLGLAGLLFWLAFGFLPAGGYWSVDTGYKRLQAGNVRLTPWPDLSIEYPGRDLDPELHFVPLGKLFHYRVSGRIHLAQSPAAGIVAQPFLPALGERGALVVPVLAGLACLWPVGRLSRRLGLPSGWSAVCLAGLATPLLFYSLHPWEHTLALAFGLIPAAILLDEEAGLSDRRALLAGLALGLAGIVRREMVLLAGVLLLLQLARRPRRLRTLALWAAACGAALALHWLVLTVSTGNPVTPELRISFVPRLTPRAYILTHGPGSLADFLFGPSSGAAGDWMLLAALAYALADAAPLSRPALRDVLQAAALAALAYGTAQLAAGYLQTGVLIGILSASPVLVLGLAAGLFRRRPERGVGLLAAGFWLLTALALGLLTSFGPWHAALEWGSRFALAVFPLGAVLAARQLAEIWRRALRSWPARLHLGLALLLAGQSIWIQWLGVQQVRGAVAQRAAEQVAVLNLPQSVLLTNLDWLAPMMPEVYASRKLFLFNSGDEFRALLKTAYSHGVREAAFVGQGVLDPALAASAAPPGAQLRVVRETRLGEKLYAVELEMIE